MGFWLLLHAGIQLACTPEPTADIIYLAGTRLYRRSEVSSAFGKSCARTLSVLSFSLSQFPFAVPFDYVKELISGGSEITVADDSGCFENDDHQSGQGTGSM
jgi:hypothetical protein